VATDQRVWEVKAPEDLCGEKRKFCEVVKDAEIWTVGSRKDMRRRSVYSGRRELRRKTRVVKRKFPIPELPK
jgi:hypothetical protein